MHKVTVFEKVLDKLVANTYDFNDKIEMAKFVAACEEDGVMVVMHVLNQTA
ncbi:hypothetical protein [Paenibacillus polymyxa]|uniref:hypothetical protein n=1 Tax=Paenibacillus polymyxa TaxID=1406 RepID=UPI00041AF258|nr:hypothetical protein [Paenibacillus polymyxa]